MSPIHREPSIGILYCRHGCQASIPIDHRGLVESIRCSLTLWQLVEDLLFMPKLIRFTLSPTQSLEMVEPLVLDPHRSILALHLQASRAHPALASVFHLLRYPSHHPCARHLLSANTVLTLQSTMPQHPCPLARPSPLRILDCFRSILSSGIEGEGQAKTWIRGNEFDPERSCLTMMMT